jgi:hypothetical protein
MRTVSLKVLPPRKSVEILGPEAGRMSHWPALGSQEFWEIIRLSTQPVELLGDVVLIAEPFLDRSRGNI